MKITVIGGGTAGVMAATYFKSYWGDLAQITMVYDHKRPGIGVGESLTPIFDNYLKTVGVSTVELIKNCNATIKLGLKFTNWTHEGSEGFHGFPNNRLIEQLDPTLLHYDSILASELISNEFDNGYFYSNFYQKNNRLPDADNLSYRHALHVDANLLGRYIENKFKDKICIIDGIVENVIVENNNIKTIKLENGEELTADLFIDASGLERVLIKNLNPQWIDMSDMLPTDRTIPNPLFRDFDVLPVCTTAEATKNGWILDVPLSNRHGTGYVYSSKFMSDDDAKKDFNQWLLKKYNVELASDRVIKFSSGFYNEQWIGNCVAIGLASGFIEPLEATNIHHTFSQIDSIVRLYDGKVLELTRSTYNQRLKDIYNDGFEYIRFFYHTKRKDSEFWRYMDEHTPSKIKEIEEVMSHSFLTNEFFQFKYNMFDAADFNCIGLAHGFYKNNLVIEKFLKSKYLYDYSKQTLDIIKLIGKEYTQSSIDHKEWIDSILGGETR